MKNKINQFLVLSLSVLLVLLFSSVVGAVARSVARYPETNIDLGGQTVRFNTSKMVFSIEGEADLEDPDHRVKEHIDKVENMFNCEIELTFKVPEEMVDILREDVLAGDENYHVISLQPKHLPIVTEGFVHRLDHILDEEFYESYPSISRNDSHGRVGDKVYGFKSSGKASGGGTNVAWNKDLFERENLPNPYDLYDAGEWTWEKFKEIAEQATQDTTGDGEIDQVGVLSLQTLPPFFKFLVYSNQARTVEFVDGRAVVNIESPEILEAMEFYQEMVNKGIIASFTDEQFDFREDRHIGHAMYIQRGAGFSIPGSWLHAAWEPNEFGVLPMPKGPSADRHVNLNQSYGFAVIPITVDNPEEIIEVYSALFGVREPYIDADAYVEQYWEEIKNSRNFHDRKTLEILRRDYEPETLIEWGTIDSIIMDELTANLLPRLEDGESPSTVAAELKPQIQSIVNNYLDQ